jgi:hypothetical protein
MDIANDSDNTYTDMEFLRSPNLDEQEKIKQFWKHLDNQGITPYEASSKYNSFSQFNNTK